MIDASTEKTIGEIVTDDYRAAGIFKQYGLDFCCGGSQKLVDACEREGIEVNDLLHELNGLGTDSTYTHNYKHWSPAFLVDYIINNHHHFIRTKLPEIRGYAQKVTKVYGKNYPELNKMLEVFLTLKDEILSHLDKEEQVLFPYIKKLNKLVTEGRPAAREHQFESPEAAMAMLQEEHVEAAGLISQLEKLSNDFQSPEDACTTFRIYFKSLRALRDDIYKHIHLENNILFPKALKMLNGKRASL